MTSLNSVGHLILESLRVDTHNAGAFNSLTRHDNRATPTWPPARKEATNGTRRLPLNHVGNWHGEHPFHPESGWGGGWRIRVARTT